MFKKKTPTLDPKNPVSGPYLSREATEAIAIGLDEEHPNVSREYASGFVNGLAFVSCPVEADTYGLTAREFVENGFKGCRILDKIAASKALLKDIMDTLEGDGDE